MSNLEMPDVPDQVAVRLDPQATALLVLDLTDKLCGVGSACSSTIPAIKGLLDRARQAGVRVIHSSVRAADHTLLPEVTPLPGEAVVRSTADKFFGTDLEERLAGRTHAVIVGTAANGAVLYTAFGACARGLTVVVADDGISSRVPAATALARFQLLNQPGLANPTNQPLQSKAVTLSRADLIEFGA